MVLEWRLSKTQSTRIILNPINLNKGLFAGLNLTSAKWNRFNHLDRTNGSLLLHESIAATFCIQKTQKMHY